MAMKEMWPCQQYGFFEAKTWILSGWDEKQARKPVFFLQDLNENNHFYFFVSIPLKKFIEQEY